MRTNTLLPSVYTFEGAPSQITSPLDRLKRTVLACMLWEDTFYENGEIAVKRIEELCKECRSEDIANLAKIAHEKYLLRHAPLKLCVEILKKRNYKCADLIYSLCSRPDQMTELLSLYWMDGKKPLAAQLKKGLAKAFTKFDEYQLAKYNRNDPIKLKDILFLSHAKPKNKEQDELWKRLINGTLKTPHTWEVKLSAGEDKKETFQELLEKNKMGKLAILRNLRNMKEAGVSKDLVKTRLLENMKPMLPFQFISAANECKIWEDIIDEAMVKACKAKEKLPGMTYIFVDVSGSMNGFISGKSKINRLLAACAFAILLRECCEKFVIFSFSFDLVEIPTRSGMALKDAIYTSQEHAGTLLGECLNVFKKHYKSTNEDRIIVITDEQIADSIPHLDGKKYILNIGNYQNGILNKKNWLVINGFAEASIDYIREVESLKN